MKKCHICGETKNLKACIIEDCDKLEHESLGICHNSCICKNCASEEFGCCYCEGNIIECISEAKRIGYKLYEQLNPDHWNTVYRMITILENWDKFDYKWKPKKTIKVTTK